MPESNGNERLLHIPGNIFEVRQSKNVENDILGA